MWHVAELDALHVERNHLVGCSHIDITDSLHEGKIRENKYLIFLKNSSVHACHSWTWALLMNATYTKNGFRIISVGMNEEDLKILMIPMVSPMSHHRNW
jgi:hypothetical protein